MQVIEQNLITVSQMYTNIAQDSSKPQVSAKTEDFILLI